MITFKDILSSNLLDNVWAITGFDIFVTLVLALAMGLFVMIVYGRIYRGAMYSGSFAVSLVALTMIATTLILAVTSNLVLSLGMVGALSIVRFRTAIKDPLEIVFLFWSIETGIVLATGIFPLAVGVNIVIGIILVVLVKGKPGDPYILVLKCEESAIAEVEKILAKHTIYTVKSRKIAPKSRAIVGKKESENYHASQTESQTELQPPQPEASPKPDVDEKTSSQLELDIEVTLKGGKGSSIKETDFVGEIYKVGGVDSAILVTFNGGYMS